MASMTPLSSDHLPHLHANPATLENSIDPFTITASQGFLPFLQPLIDLPDRFSVVKSLLAGVPIVNEDGRPGLLATYSLGPVIDTGMLPDLTGEIDGLVTHDGKRDLAAITAVFRDYSFLASAYLLEPCWEKWSKDHNGGYGLGRDVLPKEIAGPLVKTAEILDIPPFMSYAASYALYNYRLSDPTRSITEYGNLRLIHAFERGHDPASSEAGFILTHVHMVSETGPLISGATSLLDTIASSDTDLDSTTNALDTMLTAMRKIEVCMELMWSHSLPKDYISYRTFIFGITSQAMFPNGVIYNGQYNNKALFFRGESGANDSIIPLLDHLLEIPMPTNPLTDILKDFRNYRPKPHREFLAYVNETASKLGVRRHLCSDPSTTVLYLRLLDHVRSFRWRHWLFAREYIIKRSKHPTATGGSPIVTWLPNQLMAVMDLMVEVYQRSELMGMHGQEGVPELKGLSELIQNVVEQKAKLAREVERWCQERGA